MPTKTKRLPKPLDLKKLTKRQRAVAIAKDALKWLRVGLTANAGTYFVSNKLPDDNADMRKHLPAIVRDCRVCALGACMVGLVGAFDAVRVGEVRNKSFYSSFFIDDDLMRNKLHVAFSERQLRLIEAAFEGFDGYGKAAMAFYKAHKIDHDRLRAIMKNIIANDGVFNP